MRLRHPHIIALHEASVLGSLSRHHRAMPAFCVQLACTQRFLLGSHLLDSCVGTVLAHVLPQVFLTRTHLVLAMEYAAGGDLFRYVSARRGLPEDEARWFFQQLIVAVDYCHRMVRAARSSRHAVACCERGLLLLRA